MAAPKSKSTPWTYQHLIQPIPPKLNISNIATTPASPPCPNCRHLLLPDRSSATIHGTSIPVDAYQTVDTFPDFPGLQASSAATPAGCSFCGLLRRAILGAWGTDAQPMLGLAELEGEGFYEEQVSAVAWDGAVRIHRVRFFFREFGAGSMGFQHEHKWNEVAGALEQGGGVVVGMALEFGPAAVPVSEEGEELVREVGTVLHFKVYDSLYVESPLSATRRNLPSANALNERNVEMIKGWIKDCTANHANACQVNTPWTPTRLLALDPLRLVETAEVDDDAHRYAALSYARGNAPPDSAVQTSAENLDERKEGIDLAELPRTFRDAVAVCRALGIRYLWIDALCILDDTEDWDREVAMMHKIFGHAELTIAATSAAGPQSGFLRRNISAIPAAKIGDEKRYAIFTTQLHEDSGTRTTDVDRSPWNQDAWTLVERMLSARVVHFARNKIYYECRRALHSEENDAESITSNLATSGRGQLSRQANKLLPVCAVAGEMAPVIDDKHVASAGMWRGDLAAQLLWYTEHGEPGSPKTVTMPRANQAPSWSWARHAAKIGFVRGATDGAAALLPSALTEKKFHVAVDALHDDDCISGALSLQGYSREVLEIRPIDGGDAWLAEMRAEYPWDLLVAGSDDNDERVCFAQGSLDDADGIVSARGRRFMYLHVTDEVHPTGLILARDLNSDLAWRRIGVATIFDLGDLVLDPPFHPDSFTTVVVE
ncbi:heterokaryon incompatibility protein-domain-containing protein [Parachaetomium inaequale]|uniref:Heterokaryon incompatibility protein-domain-containing protein n=1 Tax=Parachaetomium inaequale TaxID=2588326 RepID=A0AAN6PIZ4_9PEZI|nr:heterokaryon incompatibility protein-domain-containing protein [Parachaetomium inaequale]